MTGKCIRLLAFVTFCVSNCLATSIIVYDNLGSGSNVYQSSGGGWDITGSSSSCMVGPSNCGYFEPAFSFTPTVTSNFTELDLGLGYVSGTNSVVVYLMSDSGGAPGAVLESWGTNGLPSYLTCCTLQTLTGNGTIPLLAGTTYWVAVKPGSSISTYALWQYNPNAITGAEYLNSGSGWVSNGTALAGAYEVQGNVTATPEPRTALMFALGLMVLMLAKRKRFC